MVFLLKTTLPYIKRQELVTAIIPKRNTIIPNWNCGIGRKTCGWPV